MFILSRSRSSNHAAWSSCRGPRVEFTAGQFDGEQDAHRVDLVAVVATAHVAGHAEQDRMLDLEARLFTELTNQRVFRRLTKVDAPRAATTGRGVARIGGTNERDPSGVDEDAVGRTLVCCLLMNTLTS